MSNIGVKPSDGTSGKMMTQLEKLISELRARVNKLEQKVKTLEGA